VDVTSTHRWTAATARHSYTPQPAQQVHAAPAMTRVLGLLGLVACVEPMGEPPPIPTQPVRLQLDSDFDFVTYHLRQSFPTAVGGTQTFRVHYMGTIPGNLGPEIDVPYTAVAVDDGVRIDDQTGASITIRGAAPGPSTIRFLHEDGSTIDEIRRWVGEIQQIALEPKVHERLPSALYLQDRPLFAWAPGEQVFRVVPYQGGGRLVDSSMQLALDGAQHTRVDELRARKATAGTYTLSVIAGSRPTIVDFVVVDRADAISLRTDGESAPTSLQPGHVTIMCFEARSAGRYLVGLPWTFVATGDVASLERDPDNCVRVIPQQTSGNITITATAGGQSTSITLPVVAM
jgi:hypothetical protein